MHKFQTMTEFANQESRIKNQELRIKKGYYKRSLSSWEQAEAGTVGAGYGFREGRHPRGFEGAHRIRACPIHTKQRESGHNAAFTGRNDHHI